MMTEVEEYTLECIQRKVKQKYQDPLHVGYDMLTIKYNGKEALTLNKRLFDLQMCWENLEAIKETHWLKLVIYDLIKETKNVTTLRDLAQDLTEIEFELQRLWKFPEDANFHRFWEYPKCECPVLDNRDAYPYQQYINLSCPLHGEN